MRVMIVHFSEDHLKDGRYVDLNAKKIMAHCFGPFDSYGEALAFDEQAPDDCRKIALPILGPAQIDIELSLVDEVIEAEDSKRKDMMN